jgi:hypothetical protein
MSGTQTRSPMASYRDTVTELVRAGEPFEDVEQAIDEVAELTTDQRAALWLFAFSLRDRDDRRRDAQARLASQQ